MKPSEATCPKCGSNDCHRKHRRRGETWTVSERGTVPLSPFINVHGDWNREATRECITHHCRTCQFDWQTAVLKKPARMKGEG